MTNLLRENRVAIGVLIILLSLFSYVNISQTSSNRDGCARGNISRANQKFLLKDRVGVGELFIKYDKRADFKDFYTRQLPEYKTHLAKIKTVDCKDEYKYFSIIK